MSKGDRVAIFRDGRDFRDLILRKPEQVEELMKYARHGDSLHNIPEEMTHSSNDVMRVVRNQLHEGTCVHV